MAAATSASSPASSQQQQQHHELLADCTCPVCQEVFVHPERLTACRHTLCRRCIKKMASKAEEEPSMEDMLGAHMGLFGGLFGVPSMSTKRTTTTRRLKCPICREESEKSEPDSTAESLVAVLHCLRSIRCCCSADECLDDATVVCPCCNKSYCQKHYDVQIASLKEAGDSFCRELRTLLMPDNATELQQLQAAVDSLDQLEASLTAQVKLAVATFRRQAAACRTQLSAGASVPAGEARSTLEGDLASAELHIRTDDLASLARLLPVAKRRLVAAQRSHPPRILALQFQPSQAQDELSAVLPRHLNAGTYQSPYTQLPTVLHKVASRGLTVNPWDVSILSNLDGVVCVDGSLKLAAKGDSTKLTGPLLVINVQRFPTKMLHVADLDVNQVATIKPQFGEEGMPGRMYICNERQLIMTSDAGRHKVFVFDLEGQLVVSFGEKGSGPRQFHAPLGMSANDGKMFVVDSKNRRIQVFDMDKSYECVATVQCDGFTKGIHSVLANKHSVFVVDRDTSGLFVFDKATRSLVKPQLKLDGKPFDVVPDEFDNAIVTLVDEGKVQIVNRQGPLKTLSFRETHENSSGQQPDPSQLLLPMMLPMMAMGGSAPPRMFHGAAFEPTKRRLFIADLMRKCIVVADL